MGRLFLKLVVVFSFCLSNFLCFQVKADIDSINHGVGFKGYTEEYKKRLLETIPTVISIKPNQLAAQRNGNENSSYVAGAPGDDFIVVNGMNSLSKFRM